MIKFDSTGKYLATFGSWGSGIGQFNTPIPTSIGLTFDAQGNIYVTDPGNNHVQKFDGQGNYLIQFGSEGTGNEQFENPTGIAVDGSGNINGCGNIHVVDTSNNRIEKF